MTRTLRALLMLSLLPPLAQAADAPLPPDAGATLQPFVATYQVFHEGRRLGDATLQVVQIGGARWRVDLTMKGSGLMRLTGLNAQQSTLFDSDGHDYRPLTQATVRRAFLSSKQRVGRYDWTSHTARWTGDVKAGHAGPVTLQDGDMSGLLIDLAVIRDAAPGRTLHYRFVDDGRVRDHVWQVAPQAESIAIGEISYDAMRAERGQAAGDATTIWVADGVPTPVRILQREDGQDSTDLRLVEYKGAQP